MSGWAWNETSLKSKLIEPSYGGVSRLQPPWCLASAWKHSELPGVDVGFGNGSARFRANNNHVLSTYGVVRQPFNEPRVNEVTHLEITDVDLQLDDGGSKIPYVVCMSGVKLSPRAYLVLYFELF